MCFPGRFFKYIFTASAHFITVGGCIDVIGINLKTLMAPITQTLISVVLVGFLLVSLVIFTVICYRNLIHNWSVFFHSPYWTWFTGYWPVHNHFIPRSSFLFPKQNNISPYDFFFWFDPNITNFCFFNWIV